MIRILWLGPIGLVVWWLWRYLCFLFARGDAKGIPGGGEYYNRYGHRPRG